MMTINNDKIIPLYQYKKIDAEEFTKMCKENTDMRISYTLRNLGIGVHMRGFEYIKTAVLMVMNDNSYTFLITKRLYPDIGKAFKTTGSCVERAIRHAIQSIDCDDYTKIALLGKAKKNYSNKEFIMTLVELMRYDL